MSYALGKVVDTKVNLGEEPIKGRVVGRIMDPAGEPFKGRLSEGITAEVTGHCRGLCSLQRTLLAANDPVDTIVALADALFTLQANRYHRDSGRGATQRQATGEKNEPCH